MKVETIKVYKGSKNVLINKSELEFWQGNGWKTSSERQKAIKTKEELPKVEVLKEMPAKGKRTSKR